MKFDVVVVGGGHAGVEAALAAVRLGASTALISQRLDRLGALSCNPAFGGPAKGGLVREVDALGGFCGLAADQCGGHWRILGESRGPAARSTRALVERDKYSDLVSAHLRESRGLTLVAGEGTQILTQAGRAAGLELADGRRFSCGALVLAGGTFWRAQTYEGLKAEPAGRRGEAPANFISLSLKALGHSLGRLSTCTPPRLRAETVDLARLAEQPGLAETRPFSVLSGPVRNFLSCHLTWTNPETHRLVAASLRDSIFYSGGSEAGSPPRYCPSLEDKVSHYPDRQRHQIFLEPDGEGIIFPSGIPTGLPAAVQLALLRSIEGLEKVELAWPGYAISYDYVDPRQLSLSLESLLLKGLFLAGQVNGTSGYEEAAAQGLWAGANAALAAAGSAPFILGRHQALTAVMVDDLTGRGVTEPYRIFGSRAEYRLLLREDNSDLRLSPLADKLGLLDSARRQRLSHKIKDMERGRELLSLCRLSPAQSRALEPPQLHSSETVSAAELLKRPAARLEHFFACIPALASLEPAARESLSVEIKLEGYLSRQMRQIESLKKDEAVRVPPDMDFLALEGLSLECRQALAAHRPSSLGQAGRLPGMTPAALSVLAVHLKKKAGA